MNPRELKRCIDQIDKCIKRKKDNNIDNLQKLCLYCHMRQHEGEHVWNIMKKQFDGLQ